MAHRRILFPKDFSAGMEAGPVFANTIVTALSGWSQVNQNWQDPLREYTLEHLIDDEARLRELLSWFMVMGGSANSFVMVDYTDYCVGCHFTSDLVWVEDTPEVFGVGDGSETEFQLIKTYEVGAYSYSRNIIHPAGDLADDPIDPPKIYVDGVLQTVTTHYTINYSTGIVTFVSPPGNTLELTWSGSFYVPVRFKLDAAKMELDIPGVGNWRGVMLIEVRDPNA